MHICSVIIYPLEKKFIGTNSSLTRGKSRVLLSDSLVIHCPVATRTRPPICLSFDYNLQCPLLVPHFSSTTLTPHHQMFQWLRLLPYLNLPFVIGIWYFRFSSKKRKRTWYCLDLIFVTFKETPAPRSRAYCDCNPIGAFETLDISKEPISKTSIFWMFWYKQGCNWLGAIKGMALWPRGFSRGSLFKTWRKPETAHEKPLAPRVAFASLLIRRIFDIILSLRRE